MVCRVRTDMPAQIGAMLEEYRAMRSRLAALQIQMTELTASVRSPDRVVTVTVGARGDLQDLHIDAGLAARLDVGTLAGRILAATRLAHAQVREQVRVKTRLALPERLRELVGPDGVVDLGALLPEDLGFHPGERP
jgi:DNA-binding protein YbaB